MKKLFALTLALMLLLAFSACAQKATEKTVLTVALSPDFGPMEFCDTSKSGQEQFVGFDVTLANYLAAEMGLTLELKPMDFSACQMAVQTGTVDMSISGYSWTAEREENFGISDYYIAGDNETEQVIITKADQAGAFSSAADFAGMTIGAQATSLQEKLCNEELPADITLMQFKSIDDAVLALKTDKIQALAVAKGNGEAIMVNNPEIGFSGFQFDVDPKYENNVILLNKQDTELLAKVNELLAKAMAADLYTGWYEDAKALAGIETAAEISYDVDGNAILDYDTDGNPIIGYDADKKPILGNLG